MNISLMKATRIVAWKELVAAFRDKQTTLYTIVLPIAMYPFLFWALIQGALFVQGREERTEVHLGVSAAHDAEIPPGLTQALSKRPADRSKKTAEPDTVHAAEKPVAPMVVETESAARGAALIPPMLGGDGQRDYFLALQSNNEARGTGGFFGSFGVLNADDGRVKVRQLAPRSQLDDQQ